MMELGKDILAQGKMHDISDFFFSRKPRQYLAGLSAKFDAGACSLLCKGAFPMER